MGELFGDLVPREWQEQVFAQISQCPNDRFYLLTKQPQNLIKFLGGNITNTYKGYRRPTPLPENVWAGVTVTTRSQAYAARDFLKEVKATIKFLSIEPLLERMDGWALGDVLSLADWLIIGACTGTLNDLQPMGYPDLTLMPYGKRWTLQPKLEWVQEIVKAADDAGIPVFLKDNLRPLLPEVPPFYEYLYTMNQRQDYFHYRQEMANG
jgi:protein gp37